MTDSSSLPVLARLIGILIAGGAGALAGWRLVGVLGWSGLAAAIVGVVFAMVIATVLFATWVTVLRSTRLWR